MYKLTVGLEGAQTEEQEGEESETEALHDRDTCLEGQFRGEELRISLAGTVDEWDTCRLIAGVTLILEIQVIFKIYKFLMIIKLRSTQIKGVIIMWEDSGIKILIKIPGITGEVVLRNVELFTKATTRVFNVIR